MLRYLCLSPFFWDHHRGCWCPNGLKLHRITDNLQAGSIEVSYLRGEGFVKEPFGYKVATYISSLDLDVHLAVKGIDQIILWQSRLRGEEDALLVRQYVTYTCALCLCTLQHRRRILCATFVDSAKQKLLVYFWVLSLQHPVASLHHLL